MDLLIQSFIRALGSVFTPKMFGVMLLSLLLTVVVLVGFVTATSGFLNWFLDTMPWLATLGGLGAGFLAWLLFPGIMPIIVNFFDQRIVTIIERQDYPNAPAPIILPFVPELLHDVRFSLTVVFLNIVLLPVYAILFFTFILAPLIPFIFYWLNGYLLGREFFVVVARRHRSLADANALRKQYGWTVTFAGIALAIMATIPLLNLFAPLWGIAVMTHLYHALSAKPELIEG